MYTMPRLSRRNRALLDCLAQGATDSVICTRLRLNPIDLHAAQKDLFKLIGAFNRDGAAKWWQERSAGVPGNETNDAAVQPLFSIAESGHIGAVAVDKGLANVLGALCSYLGFSARLYMSAPELVRMHTGRLHGWIFEQFLNGSFVPAIALFARIPYSQRLAQDELIVGLMKLLQGHQAQVEFPVTTGFVAERQLLSLAHAWLSTRSTFTGCDLEHFIQGLSAIHPVRHLGLVVVFHHLRFRDPVRAGEVAHALWQDALAVVSHLHSSRDERAEPLTNDRAQRAASSNACNPRLDRQTELERAITQVAGNVNAMPTFPDAPCVQSV
jgi:DNA-binding CsgD family transcriptional regulator